MGILIPENYRAALDIFETQIAIKLLKDYFEKELARQLCLTRVSAPLFVNSRSGLNDNLNGVERPVAFDIQEQPGETFEIVHSLAKWKRAALARYGFSEKEGLYTDMNAIRRDEETDNIHSIYVDQWDWEKIITKEERTADTLKSTVRTIYSVLKNAQKYVSERYDYIQTDLPKEIAFVSSQELEDEFPNLSPKQREYEISKRHGAVFIMQVGNKLRSGKIHDGRAPDYDDWKLNGDIILYYPLLDIALEISSMGIRVDETSLVSQCKERGCSERLSTPFCRSILNGELPYTIGGGIGQSRICMFILQKAHVGEVQASCWTEGTLDICAKNGINLL